MWGRAAPTPPCPGGHPPDPPQGGISTPHSPPVPSGGRCAAPLGALRWAWVNNGILRRVSRAFFGRVIVLEHSGM